MSQAPLKILFAIPALDHGGPDRVMFEILTAIDRARFTPSVMVSEPDGYYLSRLPPDIPVEVLRAKRSLSKRYPVLAALSCVRRRAPDLVFATLRMIQTLGVVAHAFPRHTRLLFRQATHASTDWDALVQSSRVKHRLARKITLASLRAADAVICQSEAMERDLRELLGRRHGLHVIGNPIDVDAAIRASTATAITLPGRPALISVGRFQQMKGYDILLRATAQVRLRFPELHLTILGDGPDRRSMHDLARELGIERYVTLAGFHPEPLPFVRGADLFVLSSRYEGFPNAALESLACGTPVVLTDCPGANAQLVIPGVNGRLSDGLAPAAFANAMELAIVELDRYAPLHIIEDCRARFGAKRIVARYEDVFASVANARDETTPLNGHRKSDA